MKIGARVLKTGLAITLSLFLAKFLMPEQEPALAGIAAIAAMMPSVKQSFETFIQRVIANAIGGAIGVFMAYAIGANPIAIGISAIITIAILNALKLSDTVSLAVITLVVIMLNTGDNIVIAAILRVLMTIIGVLVAFVVNWLILPPHYDDTFYQEMTLVNSESTTLIRAHLRSNVEFSIMHRDLVWIKKKCANLTNLFNLMREEVILTLEKRILRLRQLVVYRQMIVATESLTDLLVVLHKNDGVYKNFPDDLHNLVKERIHTLVAAHEQILMKFNGRVIADEVNFIKMDHEEKIIYTQKFFSQVENGLEDNFEYENQANGTIHIMSVINSYEESLLRLNDLVRIYRQKYSQKDEYIEQEEL